MRCQLYAVFDSAELGSATRGAALSQRPLQVLQEI